MHYFLQEVVRNWYARNPNIVETENALVILAQECAHGFIDGKFISSNYIYYLHINTHHPVCGKKGLKVKKRFVLYCIQLY